MRRSFEEKFVQGRRTENRTTLERMRRETDLILIFVEHHEIGANFLTLALIISKQASKREINHFKNSPQIMHMLGSL